MASRPPPNYIPNPDPNPNPNPNQNIFVGHFQKVQIFGHVGAPLPATATSGPISRPGPPPAALSRRSIRSNGATHGSRPPNQSSNAPPGRPTSASNMANQNLNPVSQPLQRQTQQTQQRRGGMSGVIPPVRMGPAAMGQQPMTPPHAGAQQFNGQLRLNRQNGGGGGGGDEEIIRNRVVQPPKKNLSNLLQNLLQEHALPRGLFPKDITDFQFDKKTGVIKVYMPNDTWDLHCNSGDLRFSKTVTGLLKRYKLSKIEGMTTQAQAYTDIREIENKEQSEQPKWLHFKTAHEPLTRPFLNFKDAKNGQLPGGAKISKK